VTSSHLDRLAVSFDSPTLVSNAGLLLPAVLAQRLGLTDLVQRHVRLGDSPGAPNSGVKAMTVVASLLAGGDCIDDVDALRKGNTGLVLGGTVMAPSTIGIFLRSFSSGHARQLDAVLEDLLQRAWDAGAAPNTQRLTVDLDSSLLETYGLHKQGGNAFSYRHVRGYHPLFAVLADGGVVPHCRLREGRANSGPGVGSFLRQALARLRRAGNCGEVVMRADSGFYSQKAVQACQAHDARFSISIRLQKSHHELIAEIPEQQWQPIPYWLEGAADVAEIPYAPSAASAPPV
jgi:hypothetical protein